MKTINVKIVFIVLLFSFAIGCNKDAKNASNSDEYYIKYSVKSNSLPYYGVKLNTSITNESNQIIQYVINTGDWETTIGPVKRGFLADLSVVKKGWNGGTENHLKIALSISVSKKGSPFAQKKLDDNNGDARATASMQYVVE